MFEVFPERAMRDTELKCHKTCQNFYSYPCLLSDCAGNTELLCPRGASAHSLPVSICSLCVRCNILSERGLLGVLHVQSLEQLMGHEPLKAQLKELDGKVEPPNVGSFLAGNLLFLEL